jgi:fatty aldehyde-generating acyl-ACP reductase
MTDYKSISLKSRRRHPRFEAQHQVFLTQKGIFRKKAFPAQLINPSESGFQLILRDQPRMHKKYDLRFHDSAEVFEITCLWSKKDESPDQFLSGWRFLRQLPQEMARFQTLVRIQKNRPQSDRRNKKPQQTHEGRLEDLLKTQSVALPDGYPFYRRRADRRRTERREQVIPIAGNRRREEGRRAGERRRHRTQYTPDRVVTAQNIASIGTVLRDALIPHMPDAVVRKFVGKGDFVFIAHPRDQRDVVRMFPFAKWLPEKWIKKWFMRQKPFIASRITGLMDKSGQPVNGWFLIAPRWTVQMMKDNEMARQVIAETVVLAEKIGARIAGLGAFTSIVTHDGTDLLDKSTIGLTTGNPLSAAVAVQNVVKAASLVGLHLREATVAIVGAAGSVGSGCARVLAKTVNRLKLIDINKGALETLVSTIDKPTATIEKEHTLANIREVDVVIVATNSPGILIHEYHLKSGAIVIDCAQPKNVSDEVPEKRDDVLVIESAILDTPGVDCHFDLDLNRHEALGCLAETMVLTAIGWPVSYAIGKAQEHQVQEIYAAAKSLGFRLAYFRNSHGMITERMIERVRTAIAARKVPANV